MKKLVFISLFMSVITVNAQLKVLSSGYVGVNSTTPLSSFQIYDDYTKVAFGAATALTEGTSYMGLNAVRQSANSWLSAHNGTKNGGFIIYGDLNAYLHFVQVASTGSSSDQTFTDSYLSSHTSALFKGWETVFDNHTITTLYFDFSKSDLRRSSTRNNMSGDPQILFYNSSTSTYEDIKAKSFIVASDASLKTNVTTLTNSLQKIQQLRGVSFNWVHEAPTHPKSFGFIAQEVEQVIPEIVFTDDTAHIKSMNYIAIIPYLVEAIKEQQNQINTLEMSITNSNAGSIKSSSPESTNTNDITNSKAAYLLQNVPNPFTAKTTIRYYIPEQTSNASLLIFDMQGKLIKTYPVNSRKDGYTEINGGEMQPGMYMYSLIIDGKEIDTKRMILTN